MPNTSLKLLFACATAIALQAHALERTERGNIILEDVPAPPSALAAKLAPYLALRSSTFVEWTPDGALLVSSGPDEPARRIEEPRGAPKPLTPADESLLQAHRADEGQKPAADAPRLSRDGRGVYYVSDQDAEFKQLRYVEFPTEPGQKPAETRLSAQAPWDVEYFDLSDDGRYLVYATNEGGISRLRLRDVRNGLDMPSPAVPGGRITTLKFDPGGTRIALTLETARTPREVYVYQVGSSTLSQWTQGDLGPLNAADFVDARLTYYPTFDRAVREIPAFVYKPREGGPSPVVLDLRAGPNMQYRPGFDAFTQFLVKEMGVAVIAPNVRGSEGYGRRYRELDDRFYREDAVKDVGALIAWIGQQSDLDRKRVIVMGESYGGYLSLATLMHFGDRVLGGIDVSGTTNFIGLLQNAPEDRREALRAEYGDERDLDAESYLRRLSPFHHSQRITQPVLIVQGQNDPQVPAAETARMAAAMRGRKNEVWFLLAQDEGHTWRQKSNRDLYLQTAATFIDRLLRRPSSRP